MPADIPIPGFQADVLADGEPITDAHLVVAALASLFPTMSIRLVDVEPISADPEFTPGVWMVPLPADVATVVLAGSPADRRGWRGIALTPNGTRFELYVPAP